MKGFVIFLVVALALELTTARRVTKTLSVNNPGPWGDWHRREMCPPGSYAAGVQVRVEKRRGNGDDTAANSVKLFCKTPANREVSSVYSFAGLWGSWSEARYCINWNQETQFFTSFSIKVEKKRGKGDDTAMNNIRFRCRPLNSGGHGYALEGEGGPWGDWGDWSEECPPGSAICGLDAKFEGRQGGGDDTALNDVDMFCCND